LSKLLTELKIKIKKTAEVVVEFDAGMQLEEPDRDGSGLDQLRVE
jgi:hypothetical protein